jgi:hypothetical protein
MNNGHRGYLVCDPATGKYVDGKTIRGLYPMRRFKPLSGRGVLPEQVHNSIVGGLLDPYDPLWTESRDFPLIYRNLMYNICIEKKVILLSVKMLPTDRCYVVDRAHMEHFLYSTVCSDYENSLDKWRYSQDDDVVRKAEELMERSYEQYCEGKHDAYVQYWDSRVPIYEYFEKEMSYLLPQFICFDVIPLDRLNIVWEMDTDQWWHEHVLKENYTNE